MSDTLTVNLELTKPEVGSSTDTWGEKLNDDFDILDGCFENGPSAPVLKIAKGGTGAASASAARTALGLAIGSDVQAFNANLVTAAGTLTANAPMIGAGSKASAVGSRSGNTTEFATVSGTKTTGKQVGFDADGNLVASAHDLGGSGAGGAATWSAQATSFSASAQNNYFITGNSVTVTLPASPVDGDTIRLANGGTVSGCVVSRNGKSIMGLAENLTIDTDHFALTLTFRSATNDWRLTT